METVCPIATIPIAAGTLRVPDSKPIRPRTMTSSRRPPRRGKGRGRRRGKGRTAKRRSSFKDDLGPVPVEVSVRRQPQADESGGLGNSEDALGDDGLAVGLLGELLEVFGAHFAGSWQFRFGPAALEMRLPGDPDAIEEFWVFLLELVDAGFGEWTLHEGEEVLVIEAQVFGPDVQIEFASEPRGGVFRGQPLPRRCLVRLRALIEQGVSLFRVVLADLVSVDASLAHREDLVAFETDLEQLEKAVHLLPEAFRSKEEKSAAKMGGRLPVLEPSP